MERTQAFPCMGDLPYLGRKDVAERPKHRASDEHTGPEAAASIPLSPVKRRGVRCMSVASEMLLTEQCRRQAGTPGTQLAPSPSAPAQPNTASAILRIAHLGAM